MLEQLSKRDKEWRLMAFIICNDNTLADDLVQDMYIKMSQVNKTYDEINDWYIWRVIKNSYLQYLRTRKEIPFTEIGEIDFNIEDTLCDTDEKSKLEMRHEINDALDKLKFFHREILLHTSERSLRKNVEYLNMTLRVLYYNRKQALEKLKEIINKNK